MAQAPDPGGGRGGGAGAPRINRTIKEFAGMNTREFRNAVPEGSFPWLENIQPIGPGNLHSIPGRGQAVTLIPPTPVPPPAGCTDTTERGQQHLVEELRFINNDDLGGNTRTSWSYISPTKEVYTLAGDASCGGGNMPYTPTCCQVNHFLGPGLPADHPALVPPENILSPSSTPTLGYPTNPRICAMTNRNAFTIQGKISACFSTTAAEVLGLLQLGPNKATMFLFLTSTLAR